MSAFDAYVTRRRDERTSDTSNTMMRRRQLQPPTISSSRHAVAAKPRGGDKEWMDLSDRVAAACAAWCNATPDELERHVKIETRRLLEEKEGGGDGDRALLIAWRAWGVILAQRCERYQAVIRELTRARMKEDQEAAAQTGNDNDGVLVELATIELPTLHA